MKRRLSATVAAVLISTTALLVLLCLMGRGGADVSSPALAAPLQITPTVALVDPSSAPSDLDTLIVITGTDFISTPTVVLGDTSLDDVSWVSTTTLEATVPWGMGPGVYTLTVSNPGGESDDLPNAFTVTQGIGVWNTTQLYGGEINELGVNPKTPATVYALSHDVGMFRSRDGGLNWSFIYAPRALNLAIDPVNQTTIYWEGAHHSGGALYRSDDEGDTWIPLDAPGEFAYPHPITSGVVFVASRSDTEGGLWRSDSYGADGTWEERMNGLTDTQVTALAFHHPTDPMTMYLGTASGNIFRSTNGGDSWSYVSHPINAIAIGALSVNPFGAREVWASNRCMDWPNYVVRSTNVSLTTWITGIVPYTNTAGTIAFSPVASGTIYLYGCWNQHRSTNGGQNWTLFEPNGRGLALHPTLTETIYIGRLPREGVAKTVDGGVTWHVASEGLTALYPDQMAAVPGQPGTVYATMHWVEGGIYKGTQGGETWEFLPTPDQAEAVLVDPFTPTVVYVGGSRRTYRSDDSGQTWTITATINPPDECSNTQLVAAQVLRADPTQPGTLLAGVHAMCNDFTLIIGEIHRSTDYGATWTTTLTASQQISPVTDIAYDTLTETIVYAATEGSGMLRSANGGQSWQPMGEGEPALASVESIAVEQGSPYRVFVWTGPPTGIHVSEDHGETWAQAGFPLPGFFVEQILCSQSNPSVLYAAVSAHAWSGPGLYRSTDGSQTWSGWDRAAGSLGYVPVYALAEVTATDRVILYAGTTGGYVENGAAQVLNLANDDGALVNAGVYRYTTRRTWELYLPLVFKTYTP